MMGMGVNGLMYTFCRYLAGNRFSKAGNSAYLRIRSSVHGRGAVASHPWGERVLGAGRSNHGRWAMTIKEEGTTFCAFRNNYKGRKNGSCFWAFLLEMGCAGDYFCKRKANGLR